MPEQLQLHSAILTETSSSTVLPAVRFTARSLMNGPQLFPPGYRTSSSSSRTDGCFSTALWWGGTFEVSRLLSDHSFCGNRANSSVSESAFTGVFPVKTELGLFRGKKAEIFIFLTNKFKFYTRLRSVRITKNFPWKPQNFVHYCGTKLWHNLPKHGEDFFFYWFLWLN